MLSADLEIDHIGYCIISIQFFLGFSNGVDLEPPAVIVLIEEDDPGWDEVHLVCLHDLSFFLLALVEGLVGGEDVDVLLDGLLFVGEEILEDIVYPFAEEDRIVFLVIVEDANEPALVVLVDVLVIDFLASSSHTQGMLKTGLLPILSHRITEDLFVELDGP